MKSRLPLTYFSQIALEFCAEHGSTTTKQLNRCYGRMRSEFKTSFGWIPYVRYLQSPNSNCQIKNLIDSIPHLLVIYCHSQNIVQLTNTFHTMFICWTSWWKDPYFWKYYILSWWSILNRESISHWCGLLLARLASFIANGRSLTAHSEALWLFSRAHWSEHITTETKMSAIFQTTFSNAFYWMKCMNFN